MNETVDLVAIGRALRSARVSAGVSQTEAGAVLGVAQPTYHRIEKGTHRPLTGPQLLKLADTFGVRAASITGAADVESRARFAARSDGSAASMDRLRQRLCAYLELDAHLTAHGIA